MTTKTICNNLTILPIILILTLFNLNSISHAALDKWGGDDRIQHPESKHQTGKVAKVTTWTLTDSQKKWAVDELSGLILQPDRRYEVYFLIKSNSSSKITVFGSSISGHDEECFRTLKQSTRIRRKYVILNQWSVQKVRGRWSLFDPFGNTFIIKSVNGFNYQLGRYGTDAQGHSLVDNLKLKHKISDKYTAVMAELKTLKEMGFNTLGEVVDVYRAVPGAGPGPLTTSQYMPFITQIRVSKLKLANVDSFTVNGVPMWDALSPDFQGEIEKKLLVESGARTDGIKRFDNHQGWHAKYLTPYRSVKYNIPANPWYIGLDWDEEPAYLRSEAKNEHLGYRIIISAGTSLRKQRAIRLLRKRYSTITKLNSAWGARYSSWDNLLNDTGATWIDRLLSSEPKIRDFGQYHEKNDRLKKDLDAIATDFWRIYCKKVRDALDHLLASHKLNFGPGYHGWIGDDDLKSWDGLMSPHYFHKAAVSENGKEIYVDIIGIGDPMHGPHENPDDVFEYMRADMQSIYSQTGRPFWHESCWITAEADSGVTHTGKADKLKRNILTQNKANFNTSNNWSKAYCGVGSRIWLLLKPDQTAPGDRRFFAIRCSGAGEDTLIVDKELGPGNGWQWDKTPDMTAVASFGDQFSILVHDAIAHIGTGKHFNLYIPLTQEERARMYINFLKGLIHLQATNGDYIDVGYSHWEFFDYGFRNGFHEHRNWGFETVKGNLYNGTDATIVNGETQDCGNFAGPVSSQLKNIYNDFINKDNASGIPHICPQKILKTRN